jgi:hypothetical protein
MVCGPAEVSIMEGEKDAPSKVGGVVSGVESTTVNVPGKPSLTSVADCNVMELPALSRRYTEAVHTPGSTNWGNVTVARYPPLRLVPDILVKNTDGYPAV